jgi:hypothetical protein
VARRVDVGVGSRRDNIAGHLAFDPTPPLCPAAQPCVAAFRWVSGLAVVGSDESAEAFAGGDELVFEFAGATSAGVGFGGATVAFGDELTVEVLEVGDPGDELGFVGSVDLGAEVEA